MKYLLLFFMLALAFTVQAQTPDTIQTPPDYLDFDRVKIEVALHQYDSVMYGDLKEYPFGIVFQDGKGGVYDFRNAELVTEIIYENLDYSGKKDDDDEVYHVFSWEDEEMIGKLCISESDAEAVSIGCKK